MISRIGVEGYKYEKVWLRVDYSQSGDGKGGGSWWRNRWWKALPFWLPGAVVSEHELQFPPQRGGLMLISNFRRVLNAVLCLLGNLPGSELLVPTFRSLLVVEA